MDVIEQEDEKAALGDTMYSIDEETPLFQRSDSVDSLSARSIRPLPGMVIRSHGIDPKHGTLRKCPVKEALSKGRAGKGSYWIDVDADDRDHEELNEWLKQLKLSRFLVSRLAEPSQTWASQVIAFKTAVLAVIRILPETESSDEMTYMAALSRKSLLLTFTSCPKDETDKGLYDSALAYMQAREKLQSPTCSGALFAWLHFHIERTSKSIRELRWYVLKMDESMDRDIQSVNLDEIIEAKDQLLRLLGVAEEQNECLEALAGAEADTEALDFTQLRGMLSVLLSQAGATERMALRLEKHLGDLRQRYEGHQHARMNRRLAVLTVLSAVFLPLTLITGKF